MDSATVLTQVQTILRERLRVQRPIEHSSELLGDLQLDSIQQLSLIVELENHFRICFDAGDEQRVVTIGDLVSLIERRAKESETNAAPGGALVTTASDGREGTARGDGHD